MILGLLIVTLAVIPIMLKGRVLELVRSELNERLDATVDFEDVDLSLLSTFPTFTAELLGLEVTGKGLFEGKKLLSVRSLGAGVDLLSLLRDEKVVLESITIDHPEVHVLVNEDGVANYDIVKEDSAAADAAPAEEQREDFGLQLRDYRIIAAVLTYEAPGTQVSVRGLEHEGSATIEGATQALASNTSVEALSVQLGPVTYLKDAKLLLDLVATIQTDRQRVDLSELKLALNELSIGGSGNIGWAEDSLDLDVQLASPEGQSVKALISAVPNAYAADFAGLQASGSFAVSAQVKGQLGPGDDEIPSFSAGLSLERGTLKYPDLPLALTELRLEAKAMHPGGNLDKMRIEVSKFGARAGKSHAAGRLTVARPISQPDLALLVDGHLDMAEVAQAYPIPDTEALRGLIDAKVDLAATGENIKRLDGDIRVTDVLYRAKDAPPVQVDEAHVLLSPKATNVQTFRAKLGRSDLALTGTLSPLMAFLDDEQVISADLALRSKALYVDDFLSAEEDEQAAQETTPFLLPDKVDAKLAVAVKKLVYGELVLADFEGSARVRDRKLWLNNMKADTLGGSMALSGTVSTPVGEPASFEVSYKVDKVSFAEAAKALPSLRAYAPVASFLQGRFSTDLKASGELGEDGSPKLSSLDAGGLVMALQSKLDSDFEPLLLLSKAVPAIPAPLELSSFQTRFDIRDGAVHVKPFPVKAKGLALMVSGSHGLDQEMSYQVSTDVPIDKLTGSLATKVRGLGLDLSKVSEVGVVVKLTGSVQDPRIAVDVDSDALRGAVADTVSAELLKQQQNALAALGVQQQKLLAEAEKRADQLRKEGERAADKARKEAYKRADQLVAEAGNNTVKKLAAKEAAKKIRSEADKRAKQLEREADKRANQIVAEAEQRSAQLEAEVKAQSDSAASATVRKIAN